MSMSMDVDMERSARTSPTDGQIGPSRKRSLCGSDGSDARRELRLKGVHRGDVDLSSGEEAQVGVATVLGILDHVKTHVEVPRLARVKLDEEVELAALLPPRTWLF